MHSKTQVTIHETDADLYAALARTCEEHESASIRWVELTSPNGSTVTFFAPTVKTDTVAS